MIVYNATKAQFNDDVNLNRISDIILHNLRERNIPGGQLAEYHSWQNSLHFVRAAIDDPEISGDVEVAVEYQIPRTSKRVDFMIAGADKDNRSNVVVVELKQWDKAEKVDDIMQHSVRAFTGGAYRIVNHPSYQAYAYATFIKNSSEQVQDDSIGIWPCAYLHNCDPVSRLPLDDEIYRPWYEEAPLFDKSQTLRLRSFVKQFITKKSASGDLLYKIDNGRIRPSKALQDCLVSLMKGNEEFILLDDQAVVFDMCKKIMAQCQKDFKKRIIIIQGGPGTGKSVLAVNLLREFITKGLNASYCTKNSAPREAYQRLLAKSDLKAQVNIKQLFRSPFGLSNVTPNFYDCLIVDEYEIIGLNLKSQLNQGFRGLVLFLLTLKIADKAIHRRQYAQNRNLSAERGAASMCSASTRHTLPTYISFRRSTELSARVDLHRLPLRHSTHVPVARAA